MLAVPLVQRSNPSPNYTLARCPPLRRIRQSLTHVFLKYSSEKLTFSTTNRMTFGQDTIRRTLSHDCRETRVRNAETSVSHCF